MGEISTVGLDLAKSIFQLHGADEQMRRGPSFCVRNCGVIVCLSFSQIFPAA